MKTYIKAATLIVLLAFAGACDAGDEANASSVNKGGPSFAVNSAVLVETAEAAVGPFAVQGDYAGEFVAQRSAEVAFEVSGRIIELDYDIGDRVEKGEVLAKIDQTSYAQQVREARAAVEVARASISEAEVAAENLEADLRRKRPLLDKQLISAREVEDLEAQLRQANQRVIAAKSTLDQNAARLQNARENLSRAQIRAPFDAKIAARRVDLGTHVGPTQPVFRVVSDANIYLKVNVPEQDIGNITVGKPVTVRIGALGGSAVRGEVVRMAPAIDPATRMLRVDIELAPSAEQEELAGRVRPGMYAQVQIELGQRDQAVTIPKQALLEERGGSPYVWMSDEGTAKKQPIVVGLRGRQRVEVVDGLEGSETIVLRGFEKLEPGVEVQSLANVKLEQNDQEQPRSAENGDEG